MLKWNATYPPLKSLVTCFAITALSAYAILVTSLFVFFPASQQSLLVSFFMALLFGLIGALAYAVVIQTQRLAELDDAKRAKLAPAEDQPTF